MVSVAGMSLAHAAGLFKSASLQLLYHQFNLNDFPRDQIGHRYLARLHNAPFFVPLLDHSVARPRWKALLKKFTAFKMYRCHFQRGTVSIACDDSYLALQTIHREHEPPSNRRLSSLSPNGHVSRLPFNDLHPCCRHKEVSL